MNITDRISEFRVLGEKNTKEARELAIELLQKALIEYNGKDEYQLHIFRVIIRQLIPPTNNV